jgi:outer membrane protein OmpA-like peptidoglycan-associated protein
MKLKTTLMLATAAMFGLAACTVDPNAYPNDPNARTKQGAVAGALLGGIAAASASDNELRDGLLGAAAGGLIGGAIGNSLDKQAASLRGQLSGNTTVTNNGKYLTVTLPQDILFAVDSASLRPDLRRDLQAVSQNLINYPNSRIEVIGHTDNTGASAYNQDLSERRAAAVASELTANGVPFNRVSSYGRGETQPVASNLTPQGQSQNRRVEIIIRPTN